MLQNLDRLKVFYHVHSLGSVVAAAQTLHVSQSAVSQAIQKLEKEIRSPLFTRLHKQMVPTAAGERLYKVVQPFMVDLAEYLQEMAVAKDHPTGELRLGAPPEFGKVYLPPVVADFRDRYPEVVFTLEFGPPDKLLPLLRQGVLDFALVDVFMTNQTPSSHLDFYHFNPVAEEEVILACSSHYYQSCLRGDCNLQSLMRQNFISYRKDLQAIRQWFKHHFSKTNVPVREVLTVDSHETVISAIKNHVGLGVVASHLIAEELRTGDIVHIETANPEITNSISLVHLQDKVPTLTEKVFQRFLVTTVSETIGRLSSGLKILHH